MQTLYVVTIKSVNEVWVVPSTSVRGAISRAVYRSRLKAGLWLPEDKVHRYDQRKRFSVRLATTEQVESFRKIYPTAMVDWKAVA